MHLDHIRGLLCDYHTENKNNPDKHWNNGKIYCSQISYRILMLEFQHLKPFLIPIEMNKFVEVMKIPESYA